MSTDPYVQSDLAFQTRCLPGSLAEQQEQERMEEFHRAKALRKEEEAKNKPLLEAEREKKFLAARQAYEERNKNSRSRNYNR